MYIDFPDNISQLLSIYIQFPMIKNCVADILGTPSWQIWYVQEPITGQSECKLIYIFVCSH